MTVKKLFIWSFVALYLGIGIVSTVHSYEFFGLANLSWMAIVLACCFEIGQAATLFSIFNNADTVASGKKLKRSEKVIPWILMIVLTLVQIFGNLYSSYRYLDINNGENVPYFAIPVLSVIGVDIENKQTVQIIISYIMGAILPILALLLTAMVDSFMKRPEDDEEKEQKQKSIVTRTDEPSLKTQSVIEKEDTQWEQTHDEVEPVVEEEVKEEAPVVEESIAKEEVKVEPTPAPEPVKPLTYNAMPAYSRDIIRNNGIQIKK